MIFLIFCLLVSFCLCGEDRYFRFNNGISIKGNKNPITLSGTLWYSDWGNINVWFYGMDYSTMTPLYLSLTHKAELTTDSKVDLNCRLAEHGHEYERLSGKAHLRFYSDGCELSAECYTQTGDHI